MTNNTYSEEDIRKGFKAIAPEFHDVPTVDGLLDYLRRPKPVFSKGQIVALEKSTGTFYYRYDPCPAYDGEFRHLTLTEYGKAVSDLVEAMEWLEKYGSLGDHARKSLESFRTAIGSE